MTAASNSWFRFRRDAEPDLRTDAAPTVMPPTMMPVTRQPIAVPARHNPVSNEGPENEVVVAGARSRPLESILIELGVKPKHVRHAIERRRVTRESLPTIMRDIGMVSGETVARALSIEAGAAYFAPERVESLDVSELGRFLGLMAELHDYVPIGHNERGGVLLAVTSMQSANDARNHFHEHAPSIVIASENTIQAIYRRYYAKTIPALNEAIEAFNSAMQTGTDSDNPGLVQEVMCCILRHACYQGASDIYLWRSDLAGKLKIKRDGVGEMVKSLTVEVFDRLMMMLVSNAGIGERVVTGPVDTRVIIKAPEVERKYADILVRYNFRMELVQDRDGRKSAVIRVQDAQAQETDFASIGFDDHTTRILRRWIESPAGLVLVTGPTGSGKTTTLYSMLKEIDAIDRQIITVENPVEYRNPAWIQHEIHAKSQDDEGEQFRIYLKAMLREAPDVILYGEMRDDLEVVKSVLAAAQTGHLVFTTLHTNSAAGAILRLKKMGASIEEMAVSLRGVVAQRLVPVLCPRCKRPDQRDGTRDELNKPWIGNIKKLPMVAEGCEHCGGTGIRGRRMVYEVLEAHLVQSLIETGAPISEIQKKGIATGQSMWARGLMLVAQGVVSMDDLTKRVDRDYA